MEWGPLHLKCGPYHLEWGPLDSECGPLGFQIHKFCLLLPRANWILRCSHFTLPLYPEWADHLVLFVKYGLIFLYSKILRRQEAGQHSDVNFIKACSHLMSASASLSKFIIGSIATQIWWVQTRCLCLHLCHRWCNVKLWWWHWHWRKRRSQVWMTQTQKSSVNKAYVPPYPWQAPFIFLGFL